jgi:hypothetical protein
MHDRYGMNEGGAKTPTSAPPSRAAAIINDGLTEMWRFVRNLRPSRRSSEDGRPNGVVLCKCKDYIWSGQFWPGTALHPRHALDLGFVLEDRLEHLSGTGPQPKTNPDGSARGQFHARRNLSTLLVLRAGISCMTPTGDLMDENGCAEAWTPPRRLNDEQLDRLADEITDYYEEVSSASSS